MTDWWGLGLGDKRVAAGELELLPVHSSSISPCFLVMLLTDPLVLGPLFHLMSSPPFVPSPHPGHHGNHSTSSIGIMDCGVGGQTILAWVVMQPGELGVRVE